MEPRPPAARGIRLRAVVFDCDGVLADSEGTANTVIAEDLTAHGWAMTADEARLRFLARAFPDIEREARARLGDALPQDWRLRLVSRLNHAFGQALLPIRGAPEALRSAQQLGLEVAIASNSSRSELDVKLRALGLGDLIDAGRTLSFEDVARPKPAPDLYREAIRRLGVTAAEAIVVEDTAVGASAAVAAGIRVLGYAPHEADRAALVSVGAEPFGSMAELGAILAGLTEIEEATA